MTDEELRRACERAGLDVRRFAVAEGGWYVVIQFNGKATIFPGSHPALPAFVASILVGMVRERDAKNGSTLVVQAEHWILTHGDPDQCIVDATDEQRITAAMAVLGEDDG